MPKNSSSPSPHLAINEDQPSADLSVKRVFVHFAKSFDSLLAVGAVVALYFSIPLSISLLLSFAMIKITKARIVASSRRKWRSLYNKNRLSNHQNAEVTLSDGIKLRGSWIQEGESSVHLSKKLLVIKFSGNTGHGAENHPDRKIKPYDLLITNYRGTYNSEGIASSHSRYVKDGIEIVQAALNSGYQIENITLIGISLGGSIAPSVLAHFNKSVGRNFAGLIVYNTFHRLDQFLSCSVKVPMANHLIFAFTKIFLKSSGWDYRITEKCWDALEGVEKIAFGGGHGDTLITPAISLASMLESHDIERVDVKIIHMRHGDGNALAQHLDERFSEERVIT